MFFSRRQPVRAIVLGILFLIPCTAAFAQIRGRYQIDIDHDWKFHLGHAADPHRDFNYGIGNILAKTGDAANTCIKMDLEVRSSTTVDLPHDWFVSLPFQQVANGDVDAHGYHTVGALFPENSIGWYRKT